MINITVTGIAGKMGNLILENVLKQKDMQLIGITENSQHSLIGKEIANMFVCDNLEKVINKTDVVIDFTTPEASLNHLKIVKENGKKIVIGTTGFKENEVQIIKDASCFIPIVFSANMSVGMNLLFKIIKDVANVLKDYDMEIIEAHHHHKKDAPSGTALKIAQILAEEKGKELKDVLVYERYGQIGARKKDEIGMSVIRAGDIIGDHTVMFAEEGERLEITHKVSNRNTFAQGAVKAARFINSAGAGLYDMQQVLFTN